MKKKFKKATEYPDSSLLKHFSEAWENGHDWAIKACENSNIETIASDVEFKSLKEALSAAFVWEDSPEKHNYWLDIYNSLED